MAEDEEAAEVVVEKGGMGKKLLVVGGAVGVLLIGAAGGAMFMGGGSSPEAEANAATAKPAPTSAPAIYTSLHPPLVVNLNDATGAPHFMQVTLEVMAREQDVINAVRDHAPVVRNSLILLYGSELYEDVITRAGKEKMLADGLAEVRRVMKQQAGVSDIEALYFSNLIIQ